MSLLTNKVYQIIHKNGLYDGGGIFGGPFTQTALESSLKRAIASGLFSKNEAQRKWEEQLIKNPDMFFYRTSTANDE